MEHQLLTEKKYAPAEKREHKPHKSKGKYILSRKVIDFIGCGIVLFREREDDCDVYKDTHTSLVANMALSARHQLMAESKSGTIAASLMMINWMVLLPFGPLKGGKGQYLVVSDDL